jgi:hypothetical protein
MNTQESTYGGVNVTHPKIVEAIKNCAKRGVAKEQAQKVIGMPREIIDKHYREVGK